MSRALAQTNIGLGFAHAKTQSRYALQSLPFTLLAANAATTEPPPKPAYALSLQGMARLRL